MFKKVKTSLLFFLFNLILIAVNAQDLLVMKNNDSLNCKILNENNLNYTEIAILENGLIAQKKIENKNIKILFKDFYNSKIAFEKNCYDTIFTKIGDTIICKIYEDKVNWFINYELINKSKQTINYNQVIKTSKCFKDKNYKENEFRETILLKDIKTKYFVAPKYIYGFYVNTAFKFGNMSVVSLKNKREHFFKLRLNFGLSSDFQIALSKNRRLHAGLQLGYVEASAISTDISFTGLNDTIYFGNLNSIISFFNIGPNITFRFNKNYKINNYSLQYGLNMMFYNDHYTISNYNLRATGSGITHFLNFVYDYNLTKKFNVRMNFGINVGSVNSLRINENKNTFNQTFRGRNGISLSGINIGLGLNYCFNAIK